MELKPPRKKLTAKQAKKREKRILKRAMREAEARILDLTKRSADELWNNKEFRTRLDDETSGIKGEKLKEYVEKAVRISLEEEA